MSGLIKLRGGERLHVEELLPVGFAKCMQVVDQLQLEGERLASVVDLPDGFEVMALDHLDFPLPCQWELHSREKACGEPARWSVRCTNCGAETGVLCDDDTIAAAQCEVPVTHNPCGVKGRYSEITRFVSLGRS